MIRRFQIEDLIVQDPSGVVFRALDTETGNTVALRRFFPFGVDGGGLHADEQTAYDIAVSRLAGISHPSLRSVVCGGCDPVDGMPFIVTEWIEGKSLLPIIGNGPLSAEAAAELLGSALEVCELLSHVLAEEAVWVETDVQSIVIGDESSGRRFTFWISPLKWLGTGEEPRGLESIVRLTEEIMGWSGRTVNDQAGRGLGAWYNWLRTAAPTTSLTEARESLAASVGAEPPPPTQKLVSRATVPTRLINRAKPGKQPVKRAKPKALLIINSLLAIAVIGLGSWVWLRKNPDNRIAKALFPHKEIPAEPAAETIIPPVVAKDIPAAKPIELPPDPEPGMSEEDRRLRANQMAKDTVIQHKPKPKAENPQPAAEPAAVIQWDNHELLAQSDKKQVVVEGVPVEITASQSGKTIYLLFAPKSERDAARAGIKVEVSEGDAMKEQLKPFLGKKIRVSGNVDLQQLNGMKRPDIMMTGISAVQTVP